MKLYILGLTLALVRAVCIGFQGIFNSILQRHIGLIGIMCWIHFTGFLLSLPLVVIYKPDLLQAVNRALQGGVPLPVILSGALGLVIVPGIAFAIAKTNAAATFSVVVIGQLLTALVFQQWGIMGIAQQGIGVTQIVACGLVVIGATLFFI
mgnify:CR=1 FL=1